MIEKDAIKAENIVTSLNGTAIHGDGAEATTLSEAGGERADVVVAVTGHDEDNLVICQVAKARFKVPRTIARVNNPRNRSTFANWVSTQPSVQLNCCYLCCNRRFRRIPLSICCRCEKVGQKSLKFSFASNPSWLARIDRREFNRPCWPPSCAAITRRRARYGSRGRRPVGRRDRNRE